MTQDNQHNQDKPPSTSQRPPNEQQQQILFEEIDLTDSDDKAAMQSQVIFDNDSWIATEDEPDNSDETLASSSKSLGLWRVIISLLVLVFIIEAVEFFITGFRETPITTSLYAIVFTCLTLVCGASLVRELAGLSQFKQHQKTKTQIADVLSGASVADAQVLCQTISQRLPGDLVSEQEQQWSGSLNLSYTDPELIQQYSSQVLAKVDQKALNLVAKYSSETVVLVALSPVAILDMLIVFSRNLKLIDKVSALYGLKMGYWSRIKLIRQVFANMLYIGASELIADIGTEVLSADMLGKLSARLAQGLGAGMLTARLGVNTIKLCRPVPFTDNPPKVSHVRKQVLKQIKDLIKS